jgi:H+/Cl- antiporter ClcA
MLAWFLQMTITYGTNVPAGLFLPGMIVGSALGEIMARILKENTHYGSDVESYDTYQNTRKHFVVLGCCSVLAGYTRMTYSLAVIMMETSQSLSLFIPIIFTIIVSNQIGALFTRSLYQRACRGK